MDARHFDQLARTLAQASHRRGLLGVLAALPLLGSLLAFLERVETADAKRRKRKRKRKKKKCKARSKARTCANRCGRVKNNCKKKVNCGPCDCGGGCPVCKTCNARTGVCEPDPGKERDACGTPGQVCQADGTCACDAGSCPAGQHCQGAVCVCDSGSCAGCCDEAGECQPGTGNSRCGKGGAACTQCTEPDTCGGGDPGTPGICGCTPSTCPVGANCGTVPNVCGGPVSCGAPCANPTPVCVENVCTACTSNAQCGAGQVCCDGSCFAGICCADAGCQPTGNDCVDHQCRCGPNAACAENHTCCGTPGHCTDTRTDPNDCGQCGNTCSGDTPYCWNGACVCGDVCAAGCRYATIQQAMNDQQGPATIRLCPGIYPGSIESPNRTVTLIGAGDGDNPASNTILDAGEVSRVATIYNNATVHFEGMRFTGGKTNVEGAGILNQGTLTMTSCTVAGNEETRHNGAGGGISNGGTLTMTNCVIADNVARNNGGGISNTASLTMTGCTVEGNQAGSDGDGGGLDCNTGSAVLTNCLIRQNGQATGPNRGGGIAVFNGATVTLDNTSVTGNSAVSNGGGIYNLSGTVSLLNGSTVSGNTASANPNCFNVSGC